MTHPSSSTSSSKRRRTSSGKVATPFQEATAEREASDGFDDTLDGDEVPGSDHAAAPSVTLSRRPVDPSKLTPKQMERVLKNRQAAQASRERKRAYVTDLEQSRDYYQKEANELRQRVVVLEKDKSRLANEVDTLRSEFDELRRLLLCRQPIDESKFFRESTAKVNEKDVDVNDENDDGSRLLDHKGTEGMNLRPTAQPAKNELHAASSPSALRGHLLGAAGRLSTMPLSARKHYSGPAGYQTPPRHLLHRRSQHQASLPAPLTRSLLLRRQISRSSKCLKTSSGSTTIRPMRIRRGNAQIHSLTWQQRMTISGLVNSLIHKYGSSSALPRASKLLHKQF
jgi:hypothetical protein